MYQMTKNYENFLRHVKSFFSLHLDCIVKSRISLNISYNKFWSETAV